MKILSNYHGMYLDRLIIYTALLFWVSWSIYWAAMLYFVFHHILLSCMVLGTTFGFATVFIRIIKRYL